MFRICILYSWVVFSFSLSFFIFEVSGHPDLAEVETLRLVQVLFRHGDRAPTNSYPNDPYLNVSSVWPEGMSQLTSRGKMQQFNLGTYLRERYNGFLATRYKPDEIFVMSSDMDRTIMSLESNLAGLFPPVRKWHPQLDWQPIPLRTIPWKEDRYLHLNVPCPRFEKIYHEFLQTSDVAVRLNEENKDFVKLLSEQTGVKAKTVKDIIYIQDILYTEWVHNLSLPKWAEEALPRLNQLQAEINTWNTYTDEMKRLRGGPLLDLLLKNMQAKGSVLTAGFEDKHDEVSGGGNRKMLMYSAHDSTLSRIMNTLGIFQPHNPPYAAALMLELHQKGYDYFVKIFYRNDTSVPPYEMEIPSCRSPCLLPKMMEVLNHLIPIDWTRECRSEGNNELLFLSPRETNFSNSDFSENTTEDPPNGLLENSVVLIELLLSIILVLLVILFCLTKLVEYTNRRETLRREPRTFYYGFGKQGYGYV